MSANRTLQHSMYVACSCLGAVLHTPGFDYTAVAVALGDTGARPLYISLAGTASTTHFRISTGAQIFWPGLPAPSGVLGVFCTSSGAEYSLNLFGG